ncbi:hypothetical protein FO059_01925 [Tomitella fengzijianii]|uniref:Uncharacterized protein n=1 Tax=Tomitella fengzijianii TaxID=2597660 RepID=A0A516WZQ3_9ACTN|nr:hypothetical protein FO059_01925 [Tomitella fengzijianii]
MPETTGRGTGCCGGCCGGGCCRVCPGRACCCRACSRGGCWPGRACCCRGVNGRDRSPWQCGHQRAGTGPAGPTATGQNVPQRVHC